MDGHDEITRILESLVQDNETLKHDNGELQQLLTDTREDFASLQEEHEEYKANPPFALSGGERVALALISLILIRPCSSEYSEFEAFA
jgi:energy-coupling factor transporter ATP-binding protein EcfA2